MRAGAPPDAEWMRTLPRQLLPRCVGGARRDRCGDRCRRARLRPKPDAGHLVAWKPTHGVNYGFRIPSFVSNRANAETDWLRELLVDGPVREDFRMADKELQITKSTRHAKICGNFGEATVLYWLSKYGFECALVDHTGIDIIARSPHSKEIMGISVKSRCRTEKTEQDYITIPNDNFTKAEAACNAFGCVPYFAIVVDAGDTIRAFILPMSHLLECFPRGKQSAGWKMTDTHLSRYADDPAIKTFEFKTQTNRWW